MNDQVNQHFNHFNIQTGTHQQSSSTQHCDMPHGDSSEVTDQTSSQWTPHPLQGLPYHHGNQQQLQDGAPSLPNPQSNAVPHQHIPPSDRTLPPPQTLSCPSDRIQTSIQQSQSNSRFSTDTLYTDPYLMSMVYRSAFWPYPFQSLAYGPPYPGPYNSSFTLPSLPNVQRMIHPGGLANSHSVTPPVRETSSQSASPFLGTAGQMPSQLNLPPPMVYSQALPSQHLPPSSGTVQQQLSNQQPDSNPILTDDLTPHPQGHLQQTSQQNAAYPCIPQWCPQQFFAGLNLLNELQYYHNPHFRASFQLQNPVITSLPPPPVQPHYTDQSLYTNVDSPTEQSFSNQPTSNQSSANLLNVEPTIPHSTFQPTSLSDSSMTDSTESRSSHGTSTPTPKRPRLSSHNTLVPIMSEIEQPEPCVISLPTVASKCLQTVGILSSRNTQRPHCSDSNPAVLESFSDSQHTESQVKMDLSGDHCTLVPTQTTMQHNSTSTDHPSLTSSCTTQQNQSTVNQASSVTQNMLTIEHNKMCQKQTPDASASSESPHPQLSALPAISAENFDLVYNTLYSVRAKWYEFGLALGLLTDTLDSIEVNEYHKTEGCLRRMLCKRMELDRLTWNEVIAALRRRIVSRNDLAVKIEKGDLNYFNKAGVVYDLSGEPTLKELCSLPVDKKVWYQLGVWLGVEDIILSQEKRYWPSDKLKWIFTAFLNLPIGTKQYKELVKELSQELQQQAEELLRELKVNDFIKLFPSSKQTAAEELVKKRKDPKYPILITALVKVGQRKIAEKVSSKKGTCIGSFVNTVHNF